ncbi:MAG: prepilin-type N-terminal cleavage/methylation domain-containing protein [Planctomycetota bacterium]|nr:MAG: prepilin-type N-terminal cleavage/methylation domain-containing protein [Planctomycetota bacterium]
MLHRIQKKMPIRLRGFTLIEVMIAIALGSMIMIMAILAVRASMDALRTLEHHARVNDAIRVGWMALADDMDYWRSHADEEYPYGRGFMREGPDASGGGDPKRPFREWVPASDTPSRERGGMIDPSRPGAYILSGHLPAIIGSFSARVPASGHLGDYQLFTDEDYDTFNARRKEADEGGANAFPLLTRSWRLMTNLWEGPDPLTTFPVTRDNLIDVNNKEAFRIEGEAGWETYYNHTVEQWNNIRGVARGELKVSLSLPKGWAPRTIMGDWPSLANYERSVGLGADEPHLQAVQRAAFRNLGHVGVASYAPPGAGTLIAEPPDNLFDRTIWAPDFTSAAMPHPRSVRQGAVPGSLTGAVRDPLGSADAANDYITGMPGSGVMLHVAPIPVQWHIHAHSNWITSHIQLDNRRNLSLRNLATFSLIGTFRAYSGSSQPWRTITPASNLASGNMKIMLMDYERATGAIFGHSSGSQTMASSPTGFIYANRLDYEGDAWTAGPLLEDFYRDPQRRLWADQAMDFSFELRSASHWARDRNVLSGRSYALMLERHIVWTDHLPSGPTDALLAPVSLPGDDVRMQTGIVRWRQSGKDRGLGWLRVTDAKGEQITIGLPVMGTTYRGAREFWQLDQAMKSD